MEKITAVVVTYNRLNCLKQVIDCLKVQTIPVENIIVVNNGSSDGTTEWLNDQKGLIVFHQNNVGGAGGFHRGIYEALSFSNDWIWCMDDDVYPRKDCLEKLLSYDGENVGIICPRRIQNGKTFYSEYKKLNLSNPFLPLHAEALGDSDIEGDCPVSIMGMVFEGPLIKRETINKIGLPTKELFIFYDDTDYSYRAVLAGYKVLYAPVAIIDKELFFKQIKYEEMIRMQRWRIWYNIRNAAYFCHHYGKNFWFRKWGEKWFAWKMTIVILYNLIRANKKYDKDDLPKPLRMYKKGHNELLGKI